MSKPNQKTMTLAQALKKDEEATKDDYQALSKAKIDIMSRPNSTFYSYVTLKLRHAFYEGLPTAATDGVVVAYCREWYMALLPPKRTGLSLHEVMHCAYKHMFRFTMHPDWCEDLAGIAADQAINTQLTHHKFEIPDGGYCDMKYLGWSVEQIYEDLVAQNFQPPPQYQPDVLPAGCIEGPNGDGQNKPDPGKGPTIEVEKAINDKMDDILIQGVLQSRANGDEPGSIPGDIERYVEQLLNPIVPWHRVLSAFMTKIARNDYSLRRPNRRFMPDFYLPTLYSEKITNVAVSVDVSGSINEDEFQHFISEVAAIIDRLKPDETTFFQWDTRIIGEPETLKSLRDLKTKVEFNGGGGTDIEPALEWAQQNKPDLYIVFTDGYYSEPSIRLRCPTIFVVHSNPEYRAPFGKTITYNYDDIK